MILNPGADTPQKTVVIVGVQRGGTSMVAGAVRELGIDLGRKLGINHEDPIFITKDEEKIIATIRQRNERLDVWGWKMPHTSEYLLRILPEVRNPFVIVVFRNLLAIAESQMKRSGATFATAFQFSVNRSAQVAQIVPELKCPTLLVDYEKAIASPQLFIAELVEFLHLKADDEAQSRALNIIDPQVGYQRLSTERWTYAFVAAPAVASAVETIDMIADASKLPKTSRGEQFVEFKGIGLDEVTLALDCVRPEELVRVVPNLGNGFSGPMGERIRLKPGLNTLAVRGVGKIKAIRVFPSFDANGQANIRSVSRFA